MHYGKTFIVALFAVLVMGGVVGATDAGNVDCSSGTVDLNVAGALYTLNSSITTTYACFSVSAGNVTLDCRGYSISGNNGAITGFYSNQFNTTIKNCNISSFRYGVYYNAATNGTISNVSMTITYATTGKGIYFLDSDFNKISNVYITATSGNGILLASGSDGNEFINTSFFASTNSAFYLSGSDLNIIKTSNITTGTVMALRIDANSNDNVFCLNNINSSSGTYVNDTNGGNFYNCTYEGKNQGNIYGNVVNGTVQITGTTASSISGYYIGTGGAGYPYNVSTSQGKFVCQNATSNYSGCGDYAPLFPFAAPTDSCTYSGSGNWTINLSDNCNITSSVNLGANYIIYNGTGTVTYKNESSRITLNAKGEILSNIAGIFKQFIQSLLWKNYTG